MVEKPSKSSVSKLRKQYETNISCAVDIYDGYNFTNYIGIIASDWTLFNSTYNDKASSVWGYY